MPDGAGKARRRNKKDVIQQPGRRQIIRGLVKGYRRGSKNTHTHTGHRAAGRVGTRSSDGDARNYNSLTASGADGNFFFTPLIIRPNGSRRGAGGFYAAIAEFGSGGEIETGVRGKTREQYER